MTGASAGIGAAIAEALAVHGMKVVAVARRLEKLKALASQLKGSKGEVHPLECDLRKEEAILRVFEWTEKQLGGVDVLVNNAGVIEPGWITDSTTEAYRKILDVNVLAVAICSREAVRSMKNRGATCHIININSLAGHFAESIHIPLNLYPASKYALTGMTLGLRNEITAQKLDIRITSISPGAVKTEMIGQAGLPEKVLKVLPTLRDKDIADAVIYALGTPPNVQVTELMIMPQSSTTDPSDVWTQRK